MTAVIWENEELGAKFKVWPLADAPSAQVNFFESLIYIFHVRLASLKRSNNGF
jgi:hypothetical protein